MVKITSPQIPTTTKEFPSQEDFPSPQWADIPGFPTGVQNMGQEGCVCLSQYMGEIEGRGGGLKFC